MTGSLGKDWTGSSGEGQDRSGSSGKGQARTGSSWEGQDRTSSSGEGQDRLFRGGTGQDWQFRGRTGQAVQRKERTGRGRKGQNNRAGKICLMNRDFIGFEIFFKCRGNPGNYAEFLNKCEVHATGIAHKRQNLEPSHGKQSD
jgi:hypothetical protein